MRKDYQACKIQEMPSSQLGNLTNVTLLNDLNMVLQSSSR
jgi:hypothetical protein